MSATKRKVQQQGKNSQIEIYMKFVNFQTTFKLISRKLNVFFVALLLQGE